MIRSVLHTASVVAVLIALLTPLAPAPPVLAQSILDLAAIQKDIDTRSLRFKVGNNWITRLSAKERALLGGAPSFEELSRRSPQSYSQGPYPTPKSAYLDWRDAPEGCFVSNIRSQGTCGSCWSFAAIALLESHLMLTSFLPNSDPDYSEQFVLSCLGGRNSCTVGYLEDALAFLHSQGTPTESCMPYQANDAVPCNSACSLYQDELVTIPQFVWVTTYNADLSAIKNALSWGPVATWFQIYESFYAYTEGVYTASGEYSGQNHYVLIVGYDDAQQCWIAKNSWGSDWGESGYFRISYDSGCGFGLFTAGLRTVTVSITTSPPDSMPIAIDGIDYHWLERPYSRPFYWDYASSHVISAKNAEYAIRKTWINWSDGEPQTRTVYAIGDSVFHANYSMTYQLAMTTSAGGIISPHSNWYEPGSVVIIGAQPLANYRFDAWVGSGGGAYSGTASSATLVLNNPITEHAHFIAAADPVPRWGAGEIWGWGRSVIVGAERISGVSEMAAGFRHCLVIGRDGVVGSWGSNECDQCIVPSPNAGFVSVAGGGTHSLGLKGDGSIVAWGDNNHEQCTIPLPNTGFIAVAAGAEHSVALKGDGSISTWGNGWEGGVPGLNADFTQIAAGDSITVGLRSDGTVMVCGNNYYGQCNVPGPNDEYVGIAAGQYHILGLKSSGTIVAWGRNAFGECNVPSPNAGFTAVAATWFGSFGIRADSTVVVWGNGAGGVLDVPDPNEKFVRVVGGCDYGIGLRSDGVVTVWGDNEYNQCGVGAQNVNFTAVASSLWYRGHTLGIKADSTVVAWGANWRGQCDVPSPNGSYVAVDAGYFHSLGLKANGSIVAWGDNGGGQCEVPSPNSGFMKIAAGGYASLGLKTDGSMVSWGGVGVPVPNAGFVDIVAGVGHYLGLKSDGSIVAWGRDSWGECNVPEPNSGFVAVAAGEEHSLGLKEDGSVVAWGSNSAGQCSVPSPNGGFVAISAGASHSLGLRADGSIVGWGSDGNGECRITEPNVGYSAIDAGYRSSLGIRGQSTTGVAIVEKAPSSHRLLTSHPNPFNAGVTIAYEVSPAGQVRMRVFDVRGRLVRTLVDRQMASGSYKVHWDGTSNDGQKVASGMYICRMEAGSYRETRRMTLVK